MNKRALAAAALARRSSPYGVEHQLSERHENDRVSSRPTSLRSLRRWAQRLARLDAPLRLHGRDIADDGAPQMTGEARAYLGMTGDGPTDWVAIACRIDPDTGAYASPLRCAIARIGTSQPARARLLGVAVLEFGDVDVVAASLGIPHEFVGDVVAASLNLLYDRFGVQPLPRPRSTELVEAAA